MTTLGVFRDDFYDPVVVLPEGLYTATSQASGTLAASALVGAQEVYVAQSGATALTLDTAVNIIGQLQATISSQIANTSQPSLLGVTWILTIRNSNGGTLTLTAGTGNTITGTATLATLVARKFLVTVTSLTTLTFQDLGGSLTQ